MKLTVLGCGDAFGSEGRYNTSFLLTSDEESILLDCGATTLVRLEQLHSDLKTIKTIIITHFHGDHYGGLPFIMLARKIKYGIDQPLTIIGPSGIKDKVYQLQEALYPGTTTVLDESHLDFKEYAETGSLKHQGLSIEARQVTHSAPSNPHGVKITWKDRSIGFSGDSEWDDSLVDLAKDTDAFIIDCNNFMKDSPGHLSYKTVLEKKDQLNTKRLLLSHMGSEVIKQNDLEFERLIDGMETVIA